MRYLLISKVQNKVYECFQDPYPKNDLSKRQALIYCHLNGEVLISLRNTVLALTVTRIVITWLEITVALGMGLTLPETPRMSMAMH